MPRALSVFRSRAARHASPARGRRVRLGAAVPAGILLALLVVALLPGAFAPGDPESCALSRSLEGPSLAHPFGFSVFGCDYLTDTLCAARTSLTVAALSVTGTVAIALLLGSLAGFCGGWVDALTSRATEVWTAVPLLLAAIVVLSALETRGVMSVSLVLVLVLFGWPAMVRLQRASVLAASAQDYVTAAGALGASPSRVLVRHVLPNAVRPLLGYASAYAGLVIGVEATLTYLGVGLQQPVLSWGLQLLQAQNRLAQAPHLVVPAGFLVLAVGSLVVLGQQARDPLER